MFVASTLTRKAEVVVFNGLLETTKEINLSFIDGMIGVLPVFETREQAEKYANGSEVLEIELKNPD